MAIVTVRKTVQRTEVVSTVKQTKQRCYQGSRSYEKTVSDPQYLNQRTRVVSEHTEPARFLDGVLEVDGMEGLAKFKTNHSGQFAFDILEPSLSLSGLKPIKFSFAINDVDIFELYIEKEPIKRVRDKSHQIFNRIVSVKNDKESRAMVDSIRPIVKADRRQGITIWGRGMEYAGYFIDASGNVRQYDKSVHRERPRPNKLNPPKGSASKSGRGSRGGRLSNLKLARAFNWFGAALALAELWIKSEEAHKRSSQEANYQVDTWPYQVHVINI